MRDSFIRKLRRFLRRESWDAERAREIESYLEIEAAENISRGMTAADAWSAARKKFGNTTLVREEIYHMNSLGILETLWSDLRYAARLLRLNPGFAAAAILSLALGIGANTAIFQLLDAVRLRTLPVKNPEELVQVKLDQPHGRTGSFVTSYPSLTYAMWDEIRSKQEVFSDTAAWAPERLNLAQGGEVRNTDGLWVSGDFFSTLGVQPMMGRMLNGSDDRPGCGASNAVISYSFWQHEYGGKADAIGKQINLDGYPFQIIGVTPPSFFGTVVGRTFGVAIPLCSEPLLHGEDAWTPRKDTWWLVVNGRLKPGITAIKAAAQLRAISPQVFAATVPTTYNPGDVKHYLDFKLGVFPGALGVSNLREAYADPLLLLLGLAGLVLLIACGNLANLMLARASAREKEIAVRLAIGASRWRLIRQLLAESLLLAFIGTVTGALMAQWVSRSLVRFLSSGSREVFVDLGMDWRVLGFAAGLAGLTCLLFGLAPALRGTRVPPGAVLKASGRGVTSNRERFGLRRVLVVAQVSLSLVLLIGALLFARSLRNLMTMDSGMHDEGVLVVDVDYTRQNLAKELRVPYDQQLLRIVRSLPGVVSAADAYITPLSGSGWNQNVIVGGGAAESKDGKDESWRNQVSTDYFRTLGTPILEGRDFDEHDTLQSPRVAIVNEAFVLTFFKGQDPIGKTFQYQEMIGRGRPTLQIVGVVRDTKYQDLRDELKPISFVPSSQNERPQLGDTILIRTALPMSEMVSAVKDSLRNERADISFTVMHTMVQNSLLGDRLIALLSGFFGLLAELLATIGLYGVMSYMVVRRRNEFGIRMALGAGRFELISMIMREAGAMLLVGLVIGTGLAILGSKAAEALLYGLKPTDPLTITAAIVILSLVAAVASYVPALRASRVNPMIALRDE
jgi:putative ABC transport system permease protein